ncbi:MAG: NUDIX hydrolase [Bacteroidetes bacterium]|nr:MAG: NUDIX hydrolase [Bacteroidota bacterium]
MEIKNTMKEKKLWQILSANTIYENNWIRVREDKVLTPAEKEGIYTTVHFKNKAIGIIPIDNEGFIYLVGQYRYPLNEYSWEIPMGGGKIGDDILASAQRELEEETGLVAEKWTNIMRIHTSNSVTDEEGCVFLAENLTQKQAQPEDTEDLVIKKISFKEAFEMVMRNEITDSLSVAGILKLAILRKI